MLIYGIEKFVIKPEFWDIPRDDPDRLAVFYNYRQDMINGDYFCRKNCQIYEDPKNRELSLAGILGYPDALKDARSQPLMSKRFSEISAHVSSREVQYFDIYPDDYYCEHRHWKSLILSTNPLSGLPSMMCSDCRGLIAKYRLSMSEQTSGKLWDWERHYDAIDDVSLLCSDYGSWADEELCNIKSRLNQSGLSIIKSLAEELNCPVYYLFDSGRNILHHCPQCGTPLVTSLVSKKFNECNVCKILIFKSEIE